MLLALGVGLLRKFDALLRRFSKIKHDRFIDLFLISPKCEILRRFEAFVESEVISRKARFFPHLANRCLETLFFAFNFSFREIPIVVSVI